MTTEIIRNNVLAIQVCSDIKDMDELVKEVEMIEPCGTQAGWCLSTQKEHGLFNVLLIVAGNIIYFSREVK